MSNKKTIKEPEVIYEDKDCAVINKPAGLMVHPDGRADGPFLTDWILKKFPKTKKVGESITGFDGKPILRPGIVHRLDRETTGAIIIAKTAEAHARLKKQFQDRLVSKKYLAFVWGEMRDEFGTIDKAIGRSSGDFRKWSAGRGAKGILRHAETYWTRIKDTKIDISSDKQEGISLIEACPKTGRTHQIRVHMSTINHPVVGDSLYAPKKPLILGFKRLALHSRELIFTDPKGKAITVMAPLPADFKKACKGIGVESKELT